MIDKMNTNTNAISGSLAVTNDREARIRKSDDLGEPKGKAKAGESDTDAADYGNVQAQALAAAALKAPEAQAAPKPFAAGTSATQGAEISAKAAEAKLAESKLAAAGKSPEAKMQDAGLSMIDKSPLTMKSAAGLNAGATIAGLKPWSRDWVFEGADENPELKGLFDSKTAAGDASAMKQGMPIITSDQAAQISNLLRETRGMEAGAPTSQQAATAGVATGNPAIAQAHSQMEMNLQAQLAGLGGAMVSANGGANAGGVKEGQALEKGKLSGVSLQQHLSGTDFLRTLGAAQAGPAAVGSQAQGGQTGGEDLLGNGASAKPELKLIDGGAKGRKLQFSDELSQANPLSGHSAQSLGIGEKTFAATAAPATVAVTGHVVQGAGAQDRLSSESLLGVSTGISNLSAQGGGNMNIRLNPGNLGELHVRVMTQGSNVGLHIQASDEKAKKIIEESMSHLKDSMASQNLNLAKVDVSIAQAASSAMGGDHNPSQGRGEQHQPQAQHGQFQDMMGQNANQNGGSNRWSGSARGTDAGEGAQRMGIPTATPAQAAAAARASAQARASQDGRLDVQA